MGRKRSLACILSIAWSLTGAAHPQSFGNAEFVPSVYIPGEAVRAYIRVDAAGAPWHEETLGTLPAPEDENAPLLLAASVKKTKNAPLIELQFVCWRSGKTQLPALTVGGFTLPPLELQCASGLSGDTPPQAAPQLEYAGTRQLLYITGGLTLAAALAVIAFASKGLPVIRAVRHRFFVRRMRREFEALLARCENPECIGSGELWNALCAASRRVAGLLLCRDFSALTASELRAQEGTEHSAFVALIEMGDAARFARAEHVSIQGAAGLGRALLQTIDEYAKIRSGGHVV